MKKIAFLFSFISTFYLNADTASLSPEKLVAGARNQIGKTLSYDGAYKKISYPMGDVPIETGVCSDVIVRAFRGCGLDLQQEVHEDMTNAWEAYPKIWNLKAPDSNIDHRRVPNLMTYFSRKGYQIDISSPYKPGDLIVWDLSGGIKGLFSKGKMITHIGIISKITKKGAIFIIHNIGSGTQEEKIKGFNAISKNGIWREIARYRLSSPR